MVEVKPLISNPKVGLGNLFAGLVSTRRALFASGESALLHPQLTLSRSVVVGSSNKFTRRKGCDCSNPEVNTYRLAGMRGNVRIGQLQAKSYEPCPGCSLTDKLCRLNLGTVGKGSVLEDTNIANVLYPQASILSEADAVAEGVGDRCPPVLGFEARITAACKERGKGGVQAAEGALHRRVVEKGKVRSRAKLFDLVGLVVVVEAALASTPNILALVERHVVELTVQVERFIEKFRLFLVRIKAISVRQHLNVFLGLNILTDCFRRNRARRATVVGTGPQRRQATFQMRESLSQIMAGVALEPVHNLVGSDCWRKRDEQMHVVRPDYEFQNFTAKFWHKLIDEPYQSITHWSGQHWTAVFGAKDKVVVDIVGCMPCSFSIHELSISYSGRTCQIMKGGRRIPLPA